MSNILVKSFKESRRGKKVILPCGLVEFDSQCVAKLTLDQVDELGEQGLADHFLEIVDSKKATKKDNDDNPDGEGSEGEDGGSSQGGEITFSKNQLNKLSLEDCQALATEAELPAEEWGELGVTKLRAYLYDKLNANG